MDFSFIVAVRRHSKSQTFRQLARRIDLDSDSKLREALRRIAWITSMRVQVLLIAWMAGEVSRGPFPSPGQFVAKQYINPALPLTLS